ncbi:nucleoside hydrolase [Herbaspirillum sp. RV1423]|uniref:nucleoside hydrolase n=1 Tax=Herbaspirillum sp. RV1423 TaxID=1443993 RepID=UPI0004AEF521|nr:nucleoside hydrolase [Herbaspirillum sp. RV1423]
MTPIIIDCDPGIDDALALLLAAGSPAMDILAVTTVAGNRPAPVTARNARKIMDLAGRHAVPVYAGAERPFSGGEARCNLVHGVDGLGGVALASEREINAGHAASMLVQLLQERPAATVELVAMGPLTNLALAEMLAPGILRRARRLLVMGGALRVPGNVTPAAEFNFYADALAAHIVLGAQAELLLFPLDVTAKAIMSDAWIASIGALGSDSGRAAAAMLAAYAEQDPLLHDACPVAYLLEPALFAGEPCEIAVDWRAGPTDGQVLAHFAHSRGAAFAPNVVAMTGVHNADLLALVRNRIAALP